MLIAKKTHCFACLDGVYCDGDLTRIPDRHSSTEHIWIDRCWKCSSEKHTLKASGDVFYLNTLKGAKTPERE